MTAALTLADLGAPCHLVEREEHLGGNLRDTIHPVEGFGAGQDPRTLLREMIERLEQAERVRVWNGAQLAAWSGTEGDFRAEIRGQDEAISEQYGALIVATGAEPAATGEYLYGHDARVVTQQELDWYVADPASQIKATSLEPLVGDLRSVVMIQCVGSRDEDHPYCSRVCCVHALKNAVTLKRRNPTVNVSVLYRDIRTLGTDELLYRETRRLGVHFFRYEPPENPVVEAHPDHLRITVRDTLYDETITLQADLLILSTGIAPRVGNHRLAELLGVSLDEDGFFEEAHPKLRPTDLPQPGVFVCGMAYGPRFSQESAAQARAAALRAALTVLREEETVHDVADVEQKLCSFCGLCVASCPYGARVLDREERVARVIDHLCRGCGTCAAVCPNGASRQRAFDPVEALALVDAALI
jgi:heterodisulfide reductase subunit A